MKDKQVHLFSLQSLVDMDQVLMETWGEVFQKHGIPIETRTIEAWKQMEQADFEKAVEQAIPQPYLSFSFLKQDCDAIYQKRLMDDELVLKEGALDYLQKLKESNRSLLLFTRQDQELAERTLDYFSLNYYFKKIYFQSETQKLGENLEELLQKEKLPKQTIIAYVSTVKDLQTIRKANIDCIYIPDQQLNERSFDDGIYTVQSFLRLEQGALKDEFD